ncbi:MAG: flagellar export chaperone FliS [bacterium]|jgi:flagellar protein FliS
MSQNGPDAYLRTKVMTAKPAELRLMLLDGAIRFTEQAKRGYESKDYEQAYNGTTRAQAILMELVTSLRHDVSPELCKNVAAVYTFLYTSLVKASMEKDIATVDDVLRILRYERETWLLCIDALARENHAASALQETPTASPMPQQGGEARPRLAVQG